MKETTILFQGDSITDGNRYKELEQRWDKNHQMGHSFAYIINAVLGSRYPERNYKFVNRGISGNRVVDVYARIYEDIIAIDADIINFLVGVNDVLALQHRGRATAPEQYRKIYEIMLDEILVENPDTKLVICEPFLKPGMAVVDYDKSSETMCWIQEAAAAIAAQYGAIFVPLQAKFNEACADKGIEYWLWDGVHPTENGHGLIASEWLKAVGSLIEYDRTFPVL